MKKKETTPKHKNHPQRIENTDVKVPFKRKKGSQDEEEISE